MPSASKLLGDLVSSAGAISVISGVANTAITGTITTAQIADNAITTAKVAASAILTADIADANVTDAKIVGVANTKITGLVTSAQIANVANTQITGRVTSAQIANTAVTAGVYGGSSNSALITVDSQGRITAASNVAASAGGLGGTTVFTSNGTFTIPTGKTVVKVTVVGAGGGSAGKGASGAFPLWGTGGGGGAAIKYLTGLTPGNTLTVTRGAGGTAGASGANTGGTGGTSSVASGTQSITTISATGGVGGSPVSGSVLFQGNPGGGGAGTNGDINITGDRGSQSAFYFDSCVGQYAGTGAMGGTSIFPATVQANQGVTGGSFLIAAQAGVNYGSGATSAYGQACAAQAGAAGQTGVVIFEY